MKESSGSESGWQRFDEMAEGDRLAAADGDPDALPLSENGLADLTPVPRIKTIRRALALSQEAFANRFHIPLGTVRDWEQGRKKPDAAARAYLKVIASDPVNVAIALERKAS